MRYLVWDLRDSGTLGISRRGRTIHIVDDLWLKDHDCKYKIKGYSLGKAALVQEIK